MPRCMADLRFGAYDFLPRRRRISHSHLQHSWELGKADVVQGVAFTRGYADFAKASPLLVQAPPRAI